MLFEIVLTDKEPPIDRVIHAGVVPRLVACLGMDRYPELQFEAAWALTNISSGTSQHARFVVGAGAVPMLVHLLGSPGQDFCEQAVWALGNLGGDSPALRDTVLNAGALPALIALVVPECTLSLKRQVVWTLSNLASKKPQPRFEDVKAAIPCLCSVLFSDDEEVLTDTCWALSYLSDGDHSKIQAVLDAGAPPRLVELLLHHSPGVQTPALRTIGNLVNGDDYQTQIIINARALPALKGLLSHHKMGLRKEAAWTLSNITAGSKEQIQRVLDVGIGPLLVKVSRLLASQRVHFLFLLTFRTYATCMFG